MSGEVDDMANGDKGGCCLLMTVVGLVLFVVFVAGMIVGFLLGMASSS